MASYTCPRCGESYDSSKKECPVCGFETGAYTVETFFGQEPEKKRSGGHSKKKSAASQAVPVLCALLLAISAVYGILFFTYIRPMDSYKFAVKKMLAGEYATAEKAFNEVPNFRDSSVLAQQCAEKVAAEEAEKARVAALEKSYAKAVDMEEAGDYQKAAAAFTELGDYSDASQHAAECVTKQNEQTYNEALALLEEGNLSDALLTFGTAGGYGDAEQYCEQLTAILEKSDELAELKVGDSCTFGTFEQDGSEQNGAEPLEWYVIGNDGESVTLLSRYILFSHAFNSKSGNSDWASCSLRTYLNSEFITACFNETEQALLFETMTSPDPNPRFSGVDQGDAVQDRVRILSYAEYDRIMQKTTGLLTTQSVASAGRITSWWLRTMGSSRLKAAYINPRGESDVGGWPVEATEWGVRPVITLKLF